MLILKPRDQLTAEDIRGFCRRFDEGIRVEYKSEFNHDVRDKLPKIVSSFANSQGGVLVVGVRTREGKPVEPIEGFEKAIREELALTVESICHENIYPILTPQVTEVASDTAGKVFLVIEVEPSPEAPHAIENSRKVYVRTGGESNPYDLADVDLIERLIKRRENVLRRRQHFESNANILVQRFGRQSSYPKVRVIVGPLYPHSPVADREKVLRFLRDTPFRGEHFYVVNELRRLPGGVSGTVGNESFGYLDTFGQVFHQEVLPCTVHDKLSHYRIADLIFPILQALYCSSRLYQAVGFQSEICIDATAFDLLGHVCVINHPRTDVLEPSIEVIPAEYTSASELLENEMLHIVTTLAHQLVWPMKVGYESITEDRIRGIVEKILTEYRV